MCRDENKSPPSLKILEITYSNFVIARAIYAFAKLGIADLRVLSASLHESPDDSGYPPIRDADDGSEDPPWLDHPCRCRHS